MTGKATRVNFRPVRLDVMLRNARERRLLSGYLVAQLIEAAQRLWPDFATEPERIPLVGHPIEPPPASAPAPVPFRPRWRRRLQDRTEENDDSGI